MKELTTPLTEEAIAGLRAGDQVLISGTIYVGRDAAHKRLVALLEQGQALPFDPRGQIIYYMGPAPTKPGHAMGSAGPTTSYRMDAYTPAMLRAGLKGMIGKGNRSAAVRQAIQEVQGRLLRRHRRGRGPAGPEHQKGRNRRLRGPRARGDPAHGGGGLPRRGHQRHEGQRPICRGS